MELEIFRQLQVAPPLESLDPTANRTGVPLRPATNVGDAGGVVGGGGGGGEEAANEELLQLLGLEALSTDSATATELLLANFCSSMQTGDENDAFLERRDDQVGWSGVINSVS